MPPKTTGPRAKKVVEVVELSDASSDRDSASASPPPKPKPKPKPRASRSKKSETNHTPSKSPPSRPAPSSASAKTTKRRSATPPSSDDSDPDPDAYGDEVLASSSSGDDDSDVFDPDAASETDSEAARRRRAASNKSRSSAGTGTANSNADSGSDLEEEFDEEDNDIGLNYHAKAASSSPAKRGASGSPVKPAKRKSLAGNGNGKTKGKKRKRDDYSDVAPSDEDEAMEEDEPIELKMPSKAKAMKKKPTTNSASSSPTKQTPKKPAKKAKVSHDSDDDSEVDRFTVVRKIVQAPTTGRVPAGQISQNTLDFLSKLTDPECNDREWFKLNEPVYRLAEKEWKAFIEVLVLMVSEVDEQVPPLPPNDVIHRIYRDVRFSNDKTPYKRNFSASLSRTGRKGKFAGYHISIRPGGSLLAAGIWAPEKNELATLRANLQIDPAPLREVITAPEFEELFGPGKPHPKGKRQNVFGNEDQLKVAPKGVSKEHPDIDLLKLRSVAVVYNFTDKEVLKPNFNEEIVRIVEVMRPLVHVLNELATIRPGEGESD